MKYRVLPLGLLAALCTTGTMATGILKLSQTELHLEPGKPAAELYAENIGNTPLYLTVKQELLTNPGQSPEHLLPISEVPHPSLLVIPNQLVLAPGQKYRIIMKVLREPIQNLVWRLTLRPREKLMVISGTTESTPTPLFISVGYGVVIYQMKSAGSTKSPVFP